MKEQNDPILNILNAVSQSLITVEEAYSHIVKIINTIQINANPNLFKFDDYLLFEKNEYLSKEGIVKKSTIFMDGNGKHYLVPKEDLNENIL